jgi:uncharacterized protein
VPQPLQKSRPAEDRAKRGVCALLLFQAAVTTDDGADALTWAGGQPWSSGIAGTFGGSYVGLTQWLPARAQPPSLRAMSLAVTGSDMYGMRYQGGRARPPRPELGRVDRTGAVATPQSSRARPGGGPRCGRDTEPTAAWRPPCAARTHTVLLGLAGHPTADDYWRSISLCTAYDQVTTPALHITGWYDIFLWAT